jgi:WD40 repeat protein
LRDEAIAAMALPDVRPPPMADEPHPGTKLPKFYIQGRASGNYSPAAFLPRTVELAYGTKGQFYALLNSLGIVSLRRLADDQEVQQIAWDLTQGRGPFLSPDEQFLLGLGNTLSVWHVPGGQRALQEKLSGCQAHAFSPDGKRLAVSRGEWIHCFDLGSFRASKRWRARGAVSTLAFHPDSTRLAVGFVTAGFLAGGTSVYDATSGAQVASLPVGSMENQVVAWHPDGERLAVGGADPRIQLWHVPARRKLAVLEGHTRVVAHLAFHPAGELLASNSWDNRLLLWQPSTGKQLLRFTSLGAPQFSADGRQLRLTWDGSKTALLEVASGPEYRTLVSSLGAGQGRYCLGDISPDGRLLAVGMDEGARVWDLGSGKELLVLPADTPYICFDPRRNPEGEPGAAASLLTGGEVGLRRWPLLTEDAQGKRVRLGSPQQLSARPRAWFSKAPDGRTLVAATVEGGPNDVLDLESGKVWRTLAEHPYGEVRALSGDGQFAASCGWHSDRVRLWHVPSCRLLYEWALSKRMLVFFTPDSRALVTSRGEDFSFWDVKTFRLIRRLPRESNQYPGWVAFAPDGRLMALEMAPGVLHLVETASARTVARLTDPHGDQAHWQGFTPDGTRLVSVASYDNAVHIWDLRAIRTRLKRMNLDWDWPEFPPDAAPNTKMAD